PNDEKIQITLLKNFKYEMAESNTQPSWETVFPFEDITYRKSGGVARIAFNRPEVRNAFRPKTVAELYKAFLDAREDTSIGVVLLSAEGPSPKDGVYSFCSGGDQRTRGH